MTTQLPLRGWIYTFEPVIHPAASSARRSPTPRQATITADPALLKALARAFRWKRMLEDGRYASVSEIARAEKIDRGYAGSILRLTLLAPEIVEAIVEGRQPTEMTLPALMEGVPMEWAKEVSTFRNET